MHDQIQPSNLSIALYLGPFNNIEFQSILGISYWKIKAQRCNHNALISVELMALSKNSET